MLNVRAELLDTIEGRTPADQLKQLKQRFVRELIDGTEDEEDRENRLPVILASSLWLSSLAVS